MRGILLSGGMDSTILAYNLRRRFGADGLVALHAEHTFSTPQETAAAKTVASDLEIELIRGSLFPTTRAGDVLPARNMLLVAWAANALQDRGGGDLYLGFCREDRLGFPDCDEHFVDLCNQILRHSGCDVFVRAPYASLPKTEILELPGHDYAESVSYSCYSPEGPCGVCSSCRLRSASLDGAP